MTQTRTTTMSRSDAGRSSGGTSGAASVGLFLARVPLGAFIFINGFQALKDPLYQLIARFVVLSHVPKEVPPSWGFMGVTALPWAQMVVGVLLAAGLFTRLAGGVAALALVGFMWSSNLFSADWKLLPTQPMVVYLGLLVMTVFTGPGRLSLDQLLFGRGRKPAVE